MKPKVIMYTGIVLLLLSGGVLIWMGVTPFLPSIQGYPGMNAEAVDVVSPNYSEAYGPYGSHIHKVVTPTSASFDVDATWVLEAFDPTGVKMELSGALNILSRTVIDSISRSVIDEQAHTNTTKTVLVHKVKCSMGVAISTFGYGVAAINEVTFSIKLSENSVNVFQNAEDSIAYILLVETIDVTRLTNIIDVVPLSQGYTFPVEPTKTVPTPQWIIDAGYTGELSNWKEVQFEIRVVTAQPTSVAGIKQFESKAEFQIGVDVLQFGFWKQVKDYNPFRSPDWGPWQWLWDLLTAIGGFIALIVGVIVTIAVFARVKNIKYALLITAVLWLGIALLMGWLDPWLGGLMGG